MPPVKRWYPVSQSLNRDPQFRELRRIYGDWMGFVWHEMLSIADQNEGVLEGTRQYWAETLAYLSNFSKLAPASRRITAAFDYMESAGWIAIRSAGNWHESPGLTRLQQLLNKRSSRRDQTAMGPPSDRHGTAMNLPSDLILVVNYAKYHKTWELENLLFSSLLSYPNLSYPNQYSNCSTSVEELVPRKAQTEEQLKTLTASQTNGRARSDQVEENEDEELKQLIQQLGLKAE